MPNLLKNVNIMKTQFFHKMKYNIKDQGHKRPLLYQKLLTNQQWIKSHTLYALHIAEKQLTPFFLWCDVACGDFSLTTSRHYRPNHKTF